MPDKSNPFMSRLDRELRQSAADSPLANALGAAVALAQAGAIRGPLATTLTNDKTRSKALGILGGMGLEGIEKELINSGASKEVVSQFLNAKMANRQQIADNGIGNVVRGFQRNEVLHEIQDSLTEDLAVGFKGQGDPRNRRAQAAAAAGDITAKLTALTDKDPSLLSDPKKMGSLIDKLSAGSNVDKGVLAGAVRNLQEKFASDPGLRRVGGLGNALGATRKDIVEGGNNRLKEGKFAEDDPQNFRGPPDPNKAPKAAEENNAGGGKLKISIARLVLSGDGSAELEAE